MEVAIAPRAASISTSARAAAQGRALQLPGLTGLRFLAALWVVCAHLTLWWRPGLIGVPVLAAIAGNAQFAVQIFFVLSGFVLAYTYITPQGTMRGSLRGYYVARLARIYPVYLLGVVVSIVPFFAWGDDSGGTCAASASGVETVIATLALAQKWLPDVSACLNVPGWTLSIEALFYVVFPVAALLLGRMPLRWLFLLLVGIWLASFGLEQVRAVIGYQTNFLLGMLLGRLFVLRHASWTTPPACAAAGIVGLVGITVIASHSLPYADVWVLPWIALLIWSAAQARGGAGRLLVAPASIALGEASYALYILHWPLLEWLTHAAGSSFLRPAGIDPWAWPLSLAYILLAIGVSLLVYRTLEVPARQAIRARWGERSHGRRSQQHGL